MNMSFSKSSIIEGIGKIINKNITGEKGLKKGRERRKEKERNRQSISAGQNEI